MTERDYRPASKELLAREACQWDYRVINLRGWSDAPEAIPGVGASTLISLRMPTKMLETLKAFAQREGVGYQVLLKRWLDERLSEERDKLASGQILKLHQPIMVTVAAAFSPEKQQILQEAKEGQ